MTVGHNGGPPLTEADVPDLTYVKFYPGDFLTGTAHLSLELRGAYITALCVMYDRMSGFPYDEREGAMLLRVDKRVYRRVRDDLLADGKFYRDGDTIRNRRVEEEIRSYIAEYIRRSNAAREREARRKLHRTSDELPANLSRTSAELIEEVPGKSGELEPEKPTKTTDIRPQEDRILESRSQKLEARKEEERESTPLPPKGGVPPLDVLRAFEAYNDLALKVGLPQASKLTPDRHRKIAARLRDYGIDGWMQALDRIEHSAFLTGQNDRQWRASLDFLCQPASFSKVHDGGYGNGRHAAESAWDRMGRLIGDTPGRLQGEVEILPPMRRT